MESNHDSGASSGRRASHARATGYGPCETFDYQVETGTYQGSSTGVPYFRSTRYRITIFESVVLINLDLKLAWYLTQDHAVNSRSDHSTVALDFLAHTPFIVLASQMAANMSVCREAAVRAH